MTMRVSLGSGSSRLLPAATRVKRAWQHLPPPVRWGSAVVALDQATKVFVVESGWFRYFMNERASIVSSVLPAFQSWGDATRFHQHFAEVTTICLTALGVSAWRARKGDPFGSTGFLLVGAGGMSNLIDRALRPNHAVVDWIPSLNGEPFFHYFAFNVADAAQAVGVGILSLWAVAKGLYAIGDWFFRQDPPQK